MPENDIKRNGEAETVDKKQKEYMTNQQKFALWMMLMVLGIAIAFVVALIIISGRNNGTPMPDIIINNDIILPEPAPTPTAEPQAAMPKHDPTEADSLMPAAEPIIVPLAMPAVPEDEIIALAKTLKGECYDTEYDDMRRVCWTVINRVESERWCNDVISVINCDFMMPRNEAGA